MGLISQRDYAKAYADAVRNAVDTYERRGRPVARAASRPGFAPAAVAVCAATIQRDAAELQRMFERAARVHVYYMDAVVVLQQLWDLFHTGGLVDSTRVAGGVGHVAVIRDTLRELADPSHARILAVVEPALAEAEASYARKDWQYEEPGQEGADIVRRMGVEIALRKIREWIRTARPAPESPDAVAIPHE